MSGYFEYSGYTVPSRNRGREYEYFYSPDPYRNIRTEYAYSPSRPTVRYHQSPDSLYSPQPRRPAYGTYGRSSYFDNPTRPRAPRRIDDSDYDADHSDQLSDSATRRPARFGGYGFNSTLRGPTQYGRSRFQAPPQCFTYDNSGARESESEYSGEIPYQRRGRSPVRRGYSPSPIRTQRSFWSSPDRDRTRSRWARVFRPPSPVQRWLRPSPPPRRQNNPFGRRSFRDDDSSGSRRSETWRGSSPSPPRRDTGRN